MRKQILVIAFLLAVGIDASAQEFTGSIYGRIVDPTNALMPGVSITVEGDAIQGPRTAESEANGSYRFLYLPPGEYRVTYQKSKFKKIVYEGAKVEVNKTITMNVTMQIADIEETLVVTGSSPIVDVQNATVGTNFGEAMLRDIPNQRDLFALLAETPGITMPRVDVGGNTAGTQSAYRAYGLSGQSITTVDGVNITAGSAGVGAYIDYGALAEAKISAAGNAAEVASRGRSGDHGDQERKQHARTASSTPTSNPAATKRYTGAETLCAVSRHQWPARWPVHQGQALVLHVIPRSVHRVHHRDVRQAGRARAAQRSAVHHRNDGLHHQAELSTQPQKHPDVHDAVGQEISTLSVRFRRRRLSIPCRVDGASE